MRSTGEAGFTLAELLVGTTVLLVIAMLGVATLSAFARAMIAQPLAVDDSQRVRGLVIQIGGWIARAGEGLGGIGGNEGSLLVPVLYPQRRGVAADDGDTTAFGDRVTILAADDARAAGAVDGPVGSVSAAVAVDGASCGPGLVACGFTAGSRALIADARAYGEWFQISAVTPARLHHAAALSVPYSALDSAAVVAADVRAISYDARRRQLRLGTPGSDQPLLDDVAGLEIRWFADPRPPRSPVPSPATGNCVIGADGQPALPWHPPDFGPWWELSLADLQDGPWCGVPPWRFDADLYRVRLLRLRIRFQRAANAQRAVSAGGERVVEFDVAPRNLWRAR
jgi:hypothetical protein